MSGFKVYILFLSWLKFSFSANDQDSYSSSYRPSYPTSSYHPSYPTSSYRPSYPTSSYRPSYPTTSYRPSYPTSSYRPSYPTSSYRPSYPTSSYHPSYPTSTNHPSYPTSTYYPPSPSTYYPTEASSTPKGSTTTTTASPGGECPDGWIESLEGCFLFHHSANVMTWREAQEECERLGGYLAEIGSEEEQTFLMSIASLEEELIGTSEWYIGLSDQGHEGRWMWQHSATDPAYTSWAVGEPNNQNMYNDCAFMDSQKEYLWVAAHCDVAEAKPLCKRDVTNEGSSTSRPTTTTSSYWSSTSFYKHVELRGGNDHSGNVYAVNRNGVLGPVCDDYIESSSTAAGIVCRQLGFNGGNPYCCSHYGDVYPTFSMYEVYCSGSESAIQDCSYSTTSYNCGSDEGFGVDCYN